MHRDLRLSPAAIDGQLNLVADAGKADHVAQLGPAAHRDAVDGDDQIAGVQTGPLGGRCSIDAGNDRTRGVRRAHCLREIRGQILDHHADPAALHFAIAQDLLHDLARHVDRHGEADPDIAAARRQDGGVDADALSPQVDEWTARITRIDRCVGLDEVLIALDAEAAAAERADDPRGHGLA